METTQNTTDQAMNTEEIKTGSARSWFTENHEKLEEIKDFSDLSSSEVRSILADGIGLYQKIKLAASSFHWTSNHAFEVFWSHCETDQESFTESEYNDPVCEKDPLDFFIWILFEQVNPCEVFGFCLYAEKQQYTVSHNSLNPVDEIISDQHSSTDEEEFFCALTLYLEDYDHDPSCDDFNDRYRGFWESEIEYATELFNDVNYEAKRLADQNTYLKIDYEAFSRDLFMSDCSSYETEHGILVFWNH